MSGELSEDPIIRRICTSLRGIHRRSHRAAGPVRLSRARRRGFRQSGDLRVPRSRGRRLHDPIAGQSRLAGKDRLSAEAHGRATAARVATLLCQFPLSFAELEQAEAWCRQGRTGELYPRIGFIVTGRARPAERVVAFYNQRCTAEQCIKDQVDAAVSHSFAANAVRLQLHALAYKLGNFMRTLARSRLVPRSSAMAATSPSKWPRSQCRGRCSRKSCR